MSSERDDSIAGRLNLLYRDRDNGVIFGVCAGIAHFFDVNVLAVRIAAVVSLMMFFVPTALTYIIAALLLKERSLGVSSNRSERDFWRSGSDYGS